MKWLPLGFIFLSCTTEPEPIKKASFELKEACVDGGLAWNPDPPPKMWNAFYSLDTVRTSVALRYNNGFWYPCSNTDQGTLEVFYQ